MSKAFTVLEAFEFFPQRDTGVPWLERLPGHWDMRKLKRVCLRSALYGANVAADSYTPDGIRFIRTTDITEDGGLRAEGVFIPEDQASDYLLANGDLLLSRSGTIGRSFLYEAPLHGPCAYAGYLVRFVPGPEILPKYLFYVTKSQPFADFLRTMVISSTIENVNGEKYANALVPLPPLSEQADIVRFIENASARIRRLVTAKQGLLNLLEEQRRGLIHRVIFCGLDPAVSTKASGIDWFREIPQHWDIRRVGSVFAQRNEVGFPEWPLLEVSLKTGVRLRSESTNERKQRTGKLASYKRAVEGDIAYNMMRMYQGAVGAVPIDGLVSAAYVVARPIDHAHGPYFGLMFRTRAFVSEAERHSRGIVEHRNRLYWEDFKQIPVPYPPPREQVQIARSIEAQAHAIDSEVRRQLETIRSLRELRNALINQVVTGQVDVRAAAARLPDEVEEAEPFDTSAAFAEPQEDTMETEELEELDS